MTSIKFLLNDHNSAANYYNKIVSDVGTSKMIALSENGAIPDIDSIAEDKANWSYWMTWSQTWSGNFLEKTTTEMWKNNLDDKRIIALDDMPGWDKYKPKRDTSTTRIAKVSKFYGSATTVGVFDINGHYVGLSTQGLPQGRYIVRQKIQGRTASTLYIKK